MVEQKAAISIPPMVPPELMTGIQITTNNKLGSGSGDFGEIIFELLGGSVVILTLPRTVDCYYLPSNTENINPNLKIHSLSYNDC